MAGILPVAYHNNKVYFLFSRESVDVKYRESGKWSDFGGSIEKGESLKETAIREGFEESDGIFGSMKNIEELINKKLIKKFRVNHYTTYAIEVPYEKDLPKYFRKRYLEVLKNRKQLVIEHNGMYEKDMIKWVELKEYKKFIPKMRIWYRAVARVVLKHFNKKE